MTHASAEFPLSDETLATLMPMHLVCDAKGVVLSAGPAIRKVLPGLVGKNLFENLEILRPKAARSVFELASMAGEKLHLRFRKSPHTDIKGVVSAMPNKAGVILNLSFGISVMEAVRDFELTAADFAPTDLTVEMLYLVEAKSAAMDESRSLNRRLEAARIAAE